jgi:hypothetical protein
MEEDEEKKKKKNEVWHCLYDDIFPVPWGDMRYDGRALDAYYRSVRGFCVRHFAGEFNKLEQSNAKLIDTRGNRAAHLAFVLLMLTQEECLRDEVWFTAVGRSRRRHLPREEARKLLMYYRVMSIATRSLFETPYDETNARAFLSGFIEVCSAWVTMDSAAMSMYCDFFASAYKDKEDPSLNDFRCDDGGMFDPEELRPKLWTAADVRRDRGTAAAVDSAVAPRPIEEAEDETTKIGKKIKSAVMADMT